MRAAVTLKDTSTQARERALDAFSATPRAQRLKWHASGVGPLHQRNAVRWRHAPATFSGHRALGRCRAVPP